MQCRRKFTILLVITSFFIIGCKAPTESISGSTTNGMLYERMNEKAAFKLAAPDALVEDIPTGYQNVTARIDAKIELPQIDQYPVVQLEQKEVDDQILLNLFQYFTKDYTLYQGGYKYTIPEIKEALQTYEDPNCTDWLADEMVKNLKTELETACNEYEWALLDTESMNVSDTVFFYKRDAENYMQFNTKPSYMNVQVSQISGGIQDAFSVLQGDALDDEPAGTKITPSIDAVSAVNTAEDFLATVGISGLKIVRCMEARQIGYRYIGDFGMMSTGWLLTYEPSYEGLNGGLLVPGEYENFGDIQYGSNRAPEHMNVYVDEHGISYLLWVSHNKPKKVLNSDVQLLEFETIHTLITERVKQIAARHADSDDNWHIQANQILLGGAPLSFDEDSTFAYYQPVWYVEFTSQCDIFDFPFKSSFVLSAISGDLVEPRYYE